MKKMNLVFLGGFSYPYGMAGTKRIQHAIDTFKADPDVSIRVVVLRQSITGNTFSGVHKGVPYKTIMKNSDHFKMALSLPALFFRTMCVLKKAWKENHENIIYNYGPPNLINFVPLRYSQYIGYRLVFDIVEDYDSAWNISNSFFHRLKMIGIKIFNRHITNLASGIVIISSHLQNKYSDLTQGQVPIHYRPISVDFARFPKPISSSDDTVKLFYSGSFGLKDGVSDLIYAFRRLAEKYSNVFLVLTGKGSSEVMRPIFARIKNSPCKDRIEYKGYLDDNAYYALLNDADILCMTRVDTGYANAGFPFKLGEFLATGKPVIASCISDVASMLTNLHEVMLVRPGNSNDIISAVEYLIDHPKEAKVIGLHGRKKAQKLFDHQTQGKALLKFLCNL